MCKMRKSVSQTCHKNLKKKQVIPWDGRQKKENNESEISANDNFITTCWQAENLNPIFLREYQFRSIFKTPRIIVYFTSFTWHLLTWVHYKSHRIMVSKKSQRTKVKNFDEPLTNLAFLKRYFSHLIGLPNEWSALN